MFRRRLLIGLIALSSALACGGGSTSTNDVSGNGGGSAVTATRSRVVQFKETEYTMAPSELTLKPGTYTFRVQNVGQFPHDLHVATTAEGTEMGASAVVLAGQTNSFTITLKPGQYTLWCSVDAHRSLGMEGTLTVK
jgi:plastocyanin